MRTTVQQSGNFCFIHLCYLLWKRIWKTWAVSWNREWEVGLKWAFRWLRLGFPVLYGYKIQRVGPHVIWVMQLCWCRSVLMNEAGWSLPGMRVSVVLKQGLSWVALLKCKRKIRSGILMFLWKHEYVWTTCLLRAVYIYCRGTFFRVIVHFLIIAHFPINVREAWDTMLMVWREIMRNSL